MCNVEISIIHLYTLFSLSSISMQRDSHGDESDCLDNCDSSMCMCFQHGQFIIPIKKVDVYV